MDPVLEISQGLLIIIASASALGTPWKSVSQSPQTDLFHQEEPGASLALVPDSLL